MKAYYYALSILGAAVISTVIGTSFVAAEPNTGASAETVVAQSGSLEQLKAQSDSGATTWRRPL